MDNAFYVVMFIAAFVVVPVWDYFARVTKDRLDGAGNITVPKKE